jgi:hypothetical protein
MVYLCEMVYLWYKQGILCTAACGALAALVSRREGALVGACGVAILSHHHTFFEKGPKLVLTS